MTFETVPLNKLEVVERNVRKTGADIAIDEMADSIMVFGLQHNLVVEPLLDGRFGILDGQRRHRGLLRLVEREVLPANWPVPVRIDTEHDGREVSLTCAVNTVAMNPADEATAYARIVADNEEVADPIGFIAGRYGKTESYVAQRVRLAGLAPEILEALRAEQITIGAASAYAGVDDPEMQLAVFRSEEDRAYPPKHSPANIRDALRRRTYPAQIKQARYVGLDAYIAAGGRVDRDLFMGSIEEERLLDPAIVDKLARDKAEAELPRLAERDGYAEGRLTAGFTAIAIWPKPPAGYLADGAFPPAREDRIAEGWIGLYELAGDTAELALRGWWRPELKTARASDQVQAKVDALAAELTPVPYSPGFVTVGPAPATSSRLGDSLRLEAQRRTAAARIAAERHVAVLTHLDQTVRWPSQDEIVHGIEDDAQDPDTVLVAVQIRVPRAELEAALQEAHQRLEAIDV